VDSLRQAQLALMRQQRYRDPFYWAPFILIGAP
jgi:CHAT domain-containing protein